MKQDSEGCQSSVSSQTPSSLGNSPTQLSGPFKVLVLSDGTVYVSDTDNSRVQKWPIAAQ